MERILLIQLRQLGDILLTTPCIKAVRDQYPGARIDFLSHPMGRLVLDDNPWLDHHLIYDADSRMNELKLIRHIRRQQYELVVDFMNNPRSAVYTRLSGAPRRAGFRGGRSWAYNLTVPRMDGRATYIVTEKFSLLHALGIEAGDLHLHLPWFESHLKPVQRLVRENRAFRSSGFRVALSPTHRRPPRRWSLESWARLARDLVREKDATVIWIWGPGEEDLIDHIMADCPVATIKAPPTTFREMAALLSNCDMFVGNSNGPSHVAVAAGLPSVQLHGPTHGASWCPPGTPIHQVVQAAGQVISEVSVEQVMKKINAIEAQPGPVREERQEAGLIRRWRISADL